MNTYDTLMKYKYTQTGTYMHTLRYTSMREFGHKKYVLHTISHGP